MSPNVSTKNNGSYTKESGKLLSIFEGTIYPYELQQKAILSNYTEHIEMLSFPSWLLTSDL